MRNPTLENLQTGDLVRCTKTLHCPYRGCVLFVEGEVVPVSTMPTGDRVVLATAPGGKVRNYSVYSEGHFDFTDFFTVYWVKPAHITHRNEELGKAIPIHKALANPEKNGVYSGRTGNYTTKTFAHVLVTERWAGCFSVHIDSARHMTDASLGEVGALLSTIAYTGKLI